MSDKFYY